MEVARLLLESLARESVAVVDIAGIGVAAR